MFKTVLITDEVIVKKICKESSPVLVLDCSFIAIIHALNLNLPIFFFRTCDVQF